MADVTDIEHMIFEARKHAVADNGMAMGIRMFDGIAGLLTEVISELRDINDKLDKQRGDGA